MKVNNSQELKELSVRDLAMKIDEWRRQLLNLRLSAVSSHVKDYSQFKKIRKNIARGLTILDQKQCTNCVCDGK